MTFQSDEEFGSFRFQRNKDWLNLDVLYVADQPEKNAFKAKNVKSGKYCRSFLQICGQTKQRFRNRWVRLNGVEPQPFSEGFCFVSTRWLGSKPKQEDLVSESRELINLIVNRYNPKIIVALGKNAAKILGVDKPIKKSRAHVYEVHLLSRPFRVLPTYGFNDLDRQSFKFETHIRLDLMRAYREVYSAEASPDIIKQETSLHRYYRTLEQVKAFHAWFKTSKITTITCDFETTGLMTHDPDERIIMACFGFGHKMAATILLDHKDHPEPENLPEIWAIVKEILEDPKINKINHNIKFDYQMAAKEPYGINMHPIIWCTQCAEHVLYEDKEDAYNLDSMTSEYHPQFENYKKLVNPIGKEIGRVEDNIKKLLSLYQQETAEWQHNKKVFQESLSFDEAKFAEELEMYNREKKSVQLATESWKKQVEIWQNQDKKTRGPKPVKPVMTRKKPQKTKFDGKKPKKSDELKRLEERLKSLKTERSETTFEDIDLAVLELYGGLDADITMRIYESQKVLMHLENEFYIESTANFYMKYADLTLPQGYARPGPETMGTPQYKEQLKEILRKIYPSTLQLMQEIVRYMPETIGDMEARGTAIDYETLRKFDKEMLTLAIEAEEILKRHAQRSDLNVKSDDEMRALLNIYGFEKILKDKELPVSYTDKTKKLSLAAEYLEKWEDAFKELNNPCGEIFRALLNHRKAHKCRETYLQNYIKLSNVDGKIHTSFFITGTSGARLSSADPNLQNVPKKVNMLGYNLKDLFIPTCIEEDTHVNKTDATHH